MRVGSAGPDAPDDRRADLRGRADADRRAGPADEGDRPLVPVRRDADALHLGRQHARLHPAAALRREVARDPDLGIYAATSSLSVTLALALLTFFFTHYEGIRWNGPVRYFKSWIPEVPKALLPLIVPLEILGQFMRLISLSVRLFANMLAGHMLILTFIGLMFILESIYPGIVRRARRNAVLPLRSRHRRRRSRRSSSPPCQPSTSARRSSRSTKEAMWLRISLARRRHGDVNKAGKAIALALGVGLGALGAGVGIGNIFGSMIQSVARQPELRGELQGIQWLGFALTEAVVFYGLLGGLLAFVLV